MTRDQVLSLDARTDDNSPVSDLRAETRQLVQERAALLEAAKYFLAGPAGAAKDRWTNGLRRAAEEVEKEWTRPTYAPAAPSR